jgi:hypothetical protein
MAMTEVMIERWTNRSGGEDFLWSVWRDGNRLHMGGPHQSAEAAEAEARDFCAKGLRAVPDRVTRL